MTMWREILTRQYLPKLLVLALAIWLHAANSMLAATTMPSAAKEIGGLDLISWAFALYLTGSIVAAASISLVVNSIGLRRTMISAAICYAIGCVICASAPDMLVLLVGRTVQGLGGGALVALVYVSQDRFFPNHFIPGIIACLSMVWMVSAFCSPMIGGAFATWGIWRMAFWAFAAQAILLVAAIHWLLRGVPPDLKLEVHRFPLVRLIFLGGSIILISLAGFRFHPVYSPLLLVLGGVSLVLFVRRDKTAAASRMLPAEATDYAHPIGNGIAMVLLLSISMMSFLVYGPVILIELYGLTPLGAGMVVMLEAIGWSVAALTFAGTAPQSEAILIRTGSAIVVAGLIVLALCMPEGPLWIIVVAAMLTNGGFGMMWGFIIKRIIHSATPEDKDRAASLLPTTLQTGFALGASLSGVIANGLGFTDDMDPPALKSITFWLFAGFVPLAAMGNIAAWRFVRN